MALPISPVTRTIWMATASNFTQLIIDTGPLIAFLQRRDPHHRWVVQQIARCTQPMLSCESVLSECLYLLKRHRLDIAPISALLRRGALIVPRSPDFALRIPDLLEKYADLPTSLADCALLELSEHYPRLPLLTLDSDFRVYRRADRTMVPLLMPVNG